MERKLIEEKVISSLQNMSGNESTKVKIKSVTGFSEIGITSADYIKLIVNPKEGFGLEIKDEDLILVNFKTFGDFINLLKSLIAKN